MPLLGAVAALLACSVTIHAQGQVFRASTDLVLLSVTASQGISAARGLEQTDFRIYEDGRPQDISIFERDPRPIALSILMDASSSMEPRMAIAQDAAIEFCRRMGKDDVAQFLSFNSSTEIRQTFTNDVGLLEKAIRETRLANQTALYTSMYVALTELNALRGEISGLPRRKALVLVSDGQDTVSSLPYDDVVERAKRSDVTIFAIAFPPTGPGFNEHNFALRAVTQATGGRVFFVQQPQELPAVYRQISDELANQYTIGYLSKNVARDGKWRVLSVRVARPDVVTRTREGYYAPTTTRVR
jgi:Ca-activated chloride channel family protein